MLRCSNETLANKFLYKLELFDMYAFKIAYWALIFIFRLRFPSGVSIALHLQAFIYNMQVQFKVHLQLLDTVSTRAPNPMVFGKINIVL